VHRLQPARRCGSRHSALRGLCGALVRERSPSRQCIRGRGRKNGYMIEHASRHSIGAWWSETQQIPEQAARDAESEGGHHACWIGGPQRVGAQQPLAYDVSDRSSSSAAGRGSFEKPGSGLYFPLGGVSRAGALLSPAESVA